MTDDQPPLGASGQAFPDLDGLLPDDPVVTVTGPWTVRSCVTATCMNCGALPMDEDTNMTPYVASTSQAAQELAQNWGWSRERRNCWPKDDLLLCPACVKAADGNGQALRNVLGTSNQNTVRPNRQTVRSIREESGSDDA